MYYSYIDYTDWECDKGGPTPEWQFTIDKDKLSVCLDVDSTAYGLPDRSEAIRMLRQRMKDLRSEANTIERFLERAERCAEFTAAEA